MMIEISETKTQSAQKTARAAADTIRACIKQHGGARILVATGNSQVEMMGFLVKEPDIEWDQVDAFHLDEYVGISPDHPASFRHWIRTRFTEIVRPKSMHYIEGDAQDLPAVLAEYSRLLLAAPVDLAFVGIGENGHIAFNDPPVADFKDPLVIKRVTLDEACRRQQVGEGHFPSMDSVPKEAMTVTCSGLFRVAKWICSVPDARKAKAVRDSLEGPVTTACPGSLVQQHADADVFLDQASASLLSPAFVQKLKSRA